MLDAAAPDRGSWIAGRAAYDRKGKLEEILDAAAPDKGSWVEGRKMAYILLAAQLVLAILFGCLASGVVGSLLAWSLNWFLAPLLYLVAFVLTIWPLGWWLGGKLLDAIFN